jgi:hypothetical protein
MTHAADTDHDITIAAGKCRDSTDAADIVLAAAITKQFDSTWAVGTNAGGMATGNNIAFELMTLDVAPGGAGWAAGDTITDEHAHTCVIAKVLTTKTYLTYDRSGVFTLSDTLTNGTDTADQGAANPTFALQVGTLHLWLIKRSDTGVVDVLGNIDEISGIAPTLPTNYDYKRLIGSYRVNVTSNIINGDWWGTGLNRTFMFDTPILDVSIGTPGTNAVTSALSVPSGIIVKAIINFGGASTSHNYVSSLNSTDMAPSITIAPLANSYDRTGSQQVCVFTNTSSQIRHRNEVNVAVYIATTGYEMAL